MFKTITDLASTIMIAAAVRRTGSVLRQPITISSSGIAKLMIAVLESPYMAGGGSASLLFFVVLITLHVSVGGTAWAFPTVSIGFRWSVLAHATWQALPLAAAVGLMAAATLDRRRVVRTAATVLLAAVFYVWLSSWAVFRGTGQFLDRESLVLALASPASMFYHLEEFALAELLAIPLFAVLLGCMTRTLGRRLARSPRRVRASSIVTVLIVISWAYIVDRRGVESFGRDSSMIGHPTAGTGTRVRTLFAIARADQSAPMAHVRHELARQDPAVYASPDIRVDWRARSDYAAPVPDRPLNVVVLVVESLRSDELEAYASRLPVMPATDRLAEESAVFLDHYAVATHSNYASVTPISSQFPLREPRTHIYPASPSYPRVHLYDVLKPHGYRTAIVSSQNESWGGMANYLASPNLDYFLHAETYTGSTYVDEDDIGFARYVRLTGTAGKIDDRATIDEAIRWIDAGAGASFVMYINLQNSHVPYPVPVDAPRPFTLHEPSFRIRFNHFPRDSASVVRGVYRNALHYVDVQVGRLIRYLKTSRQWDDTIFVLTGDHGQAFYEHGFAAHSNRLFEELLRTPLLIRAPGLAPGLRRGLAQHVDIAPTVLDLLGMPPHPAFQGVSLLDGPRRFAYFVVQSSLANQYGVVDGPNKLVVDTRRRTATLRDLAADSAETRDFMAIRGGEAARLRERLDTWRAIQLRYYRSPLLQSRYFAPVLAERTRSDAVASSSRRR